MTSFYTCRLKITLKSTSINLISFNRLFYLKHSAPCIKRDRYFIQMLSCKYFKELKYFNIIIPKKKLPSSRSHPKYLVFLVEYFYGDAYTKKIAITNNYD